MKYQNGMGLTEVIVAMLLLGIAVLGFALLQFKSLDIGEQALRKIEAINLARNLSERMYLNRSVKYSSITIASNDIDKCLKGSGCSATDFAKKDMADIVELAKLKNMTVAVLTCPDTKNLRQCIYVSWDQTAATKSDSTNDNACTEASKFKYKSGAHCVVVEAFS